jgi:hypothetical protein
MPTPLPPASDLTGASITEGQAKTWFGNLRLYLAGLLGSDGNAATARAALGAAAAGHTHTLADITGAQPVSKTGDTMTGDLTIQGGKLTVKADGLGTNGAIDIADSAGAGGKKTVYAGGGEVGFKSGSGSAIAKVNESGQMWASGYGWLHDYFASADPMALWGSNRATNNDAGFGYFLNGWEVYKSAAGKIQTRPVITFNSACANCANCADCANA